MQRRTFLKALILGSAAVSSVGGYSSAFAAGETIMQAKAMVEKAVEFAKSNGTAKAFEAFNNSDDWKSGALYIFAYDMSGNCVALGANTKMVGKNLLEMQSADGKFYLKEMIEKTTSGAGEGEVEYKWTNPETKKMQDKISFVKRIPGTDYFVGSGVYK